jgi:hypothetical protein
MRNSEGELSGGYTLEVLSLRAYTKLGIAKRPILLVLFCKEKNRMISGGN